MWLFSCVSLFVTPRAVAHQAPLSCVCYLQADFLLLSQPGSIGTFENKLQEDIFQVLININFEKSWLWLKVFAQLV